MTHELRVLNFPFGPYAYIDFLAAGCIIAFFAVYVVLALNHRQVYKYYSNLSRSANFLYATFLKPHSGDGEQQGQQAALESFYKAQADIYDGTRKLLLKGREDMLGLAASQLVYAQSKGTLKRRPVWVDIGGGTGYNIEAMQKNVDVPSYFSRVYLVDLSPSLLEVARKRFQRLGWDVKIVCTDARTFRLQDYEDVDEEGEQLTSADLITFSYSLSMIPTYYAVLDAMPSLLSPSGIIGVVDFYVQSIVELSGRTYTGGSFNRHVTWLGRVFWRAWFDLDRVGLEGARRDYLEYRFGTLKSVDERNYLLGGIPYYVFLGTQRGLVSDDSSIKDYEHEFIENLDASCTESPVISPQKQRANMHQAVEKATRSELRSKGYECAVVNLSSNLPLPSVFYQNNQRRVYYDDQLKKHTSFKDEYIYAFTWEDPRVDDRLLKIDTDDVVLCITSAGDNVLDYLISANPKRIHAVDLNPNQNHLLELKVAAYRSLPYAQFWKMFGEGRMKDFRNILVSHMSPHMSSQACQYWLNHAHVFSSSRGLYETGGSRHGIMLVRWLFTLLGLGKTVEELCNAKTLNEQREIWPKIRGVLLSRPLHWAVISTEWFAWKAAGVPAAQRQMILSDFQEHGESLHEIRGEAIWEYVVNTLDPVVQNTLINNDNYFYLLALQGRYSQRCHPQYLSAKSHAKLSKPNAFDGLRIHTDELQEVIDRMAPGTLSHAVVMDSMDWFDPQGENAIKQVTTLHRALKIGGKVLLRSAALRPWYVKAFESAGFQAKRVGARLPGTCIDRVNMYASAWIMSKHDDAPTGLADLVLPPAQLTHSSRSSSLEDIEEKAEL